VACDAIICKEFEENIWDFESQIEFFTEEGENQRR
jgi:hypothetical protein